ncbi:MAG: RHS repeat domain-containing protein, partial [Chloroflexota bacterium]
MDRSRLVQRVTTLVLLLQFVVSPLAASAAGLHAPLALTPKAATFAVAPTTAPPPPANARPDHPTLLLTWSVRETHVGVPVELTIQALGADGKGDAGQGGVALVLIRDDGARIAGLTATPVTGGERVQAPLTGGVVHLSITFETAGRRGAEVVIQGAPDIAGGNVDLLVHDVFLVLQGPITAEQGSAQRYRLVAQDDQQRTVDGYQGALALSSDDQEAGIADVSGQPPDRGGHAHRLTGEEHGATQMNVTFSRAGSQTLTLHDADRPFRPVALTVTVRPPAALTTTSTTVSAARTTATTHSTATTATTGATTVSGGQLLQRVQWAHDANNDVTSMTDANGVVTAYTYDANANVLTKTVDPSGLNQRWTFTYDGANDVLTAADPLGHVTTSTYAGHGNRTGVTNALNQTAAAYDGTGQLTSVT